MSNKSRFHQKPISVYQSVVIRSVCVVVSILNTRPKTINCRTVSTDENEMKALCFPIVATVPPFLPIFSRTISNAFYTSLSTRTYFRRGNACARERFVNGITRLKYGSNELWNLFEKVGSMIKRIWMKIFWLVRYILNFFFFFFRITFYS